MVEEQTFGAQEGVLVDLFTDTDYVLCKFTHNDFEQEVYALQAASTDYDLTGQVIWKAANILSRYMLENTALYENKRVLELGSGPGLCAFIAAHKAEAVTLTDYKDCVMELIEKNISECNPRKDKCQMSSAKLDWEEAAGMKDLDVKESKETKKFSEMKYNLVIGSDVVYWPQSIEPLVQVLTNLFSMFSPLEFYICYVERAKTTHRLLLKEFETKGFKYEEVGLDFVKSIDSDGYIYRVTKS